MGNLGYPRRDVADARNLFLSPVRLPFRHVRKQGRSIDDAGRITDFRHDVIRARELAAARYSLNTRPHTFSQSSPLASVTRPSSSKNLLGSWNMASITPPSGA